MSDKPKTTTVPRGYEWQVGDRFVDPGYFNPFWMEDEPERRGTVLAVETVMVPTVMLTVIYDDGNHTTRRKASAITRKEVGNDLDSE